MRKYHANHHPHIPANRQREQAGEGETTRRWRAVVKDRGYGGQANVLQKRSHAEIRQSRTERLLLFSGCILRNRGGRKRRHADVRVLVRLHVQSRSAHKEESEQECLRHLGEVDHDGWMIARTNVTVRTRQPFLKHRDLYGSS